MHAIRGMPGWAAVIPTTATGQQAPTNKLPVALGPPFSPPQHSVEILKSGGFSSNGLWLAVRAQVSS
uniref:Secreted protein n=1 Tax=Panagrellus redivivus TaxID=6233 RepID=A0A7E4UP05_PANRE